MPLKSKPTVRVEVSNRLDAFSAIWPRSNRDTGGRCYVFQCADLIEVWCDTIGAARRIEPQFVAVRNEDGSPLMLLPLGIERRNGIRILSFLDASIADYNAPVLFPGSTEWNAAEVDAIWRTVVQALPDFDVTVLDKMPEHVDGQANPMASLGAATLGESGHAAVLTGSWTDFEETRLPQRKPLQRKRRKLSEIGPVRFEIPETSERREAVLAAMVRQKDRRFAETGATGFEAPGKLAFFLEAGRRLANGPVHLSALIVGDDIVATHLGYLYQRRFYLIMPTYEGGHWKTFSVGRLLHEDLIEWCFLNGVRVCDFGVGDEAYKFEYCDEELALHRAAFPASPAGRLYLAAQSAKERLRRTGAWKSARALKHRLFAPPRPASDAET